MKKNKIKKAERLIRLGNNIIITHFNFDNSFKIKGTEVTDEKIKTLNRLHNSYAKIISKINDLILTDNTIN